MSLSFADPTAPPRYFPGGKILSPLPLLSRGAARCRRVPPSFEAPEDELFPAQSRIVKSFRLQETLNITSNHPKKNPTHGPSNTWDKLVDDAALGQRVHRLPCPYISRAKVREVFL